MKVLLYSANFAPEPVGIGKYSGEMAAWLAAHGHEVRVVAAPPYYPAWRLATGYAWPPYRREHWRGVDVWRAPLWVPRKPGGTARVLHLASFALASLPLMLRQLPWRPDIVISVAPALLCAPTAWMVARLCGASAWLHVQDFEVDVAFRMGLLKGRRLQALVLGLERQLLRRFDRVSSISQRMVDLLRDKGVPADRLSTLPNWVDIDHIVPLNRKSAYRAELGIADDTKVALFSGTLGSKQGLLLIPEAARLLAHRADLLFVVCGDGVMKAQLQAASAGLPNMLFLALQPFERLGQLLGLADIHLLPQSPDASDLVLPSKLSGMLASGRPVIATCRRDTEIAATLAQCGRVVPADDAPALAAAIQQLADDEPMRRALGAQARRYAERHLSRDAVLARMLAQMEFAS